MNTLVEQLAGTNRLIIIDEADHLSLDALQAVRNLKDLAGVGIVLSGNDKIYRQMKAGRRSYEFDQLRTRIVIHKKIYNDYKVEGMAAMFPGLSESCIGCLLNWPTARAYAPPKSYITWQRNLPPPRGAPLQ